MVVPEISQRLAELKLRIESAALAAGRKPSDVTLIAASKTRNVDEVQAAMDAGQRDFGENYWQDAAPKVTALPDAIWHFIGPIQSNKTRAIAEHFAWVHSIDRLKIAERLSAQRPAQLPALNVCIQVNISNENNKQGCAPEDVAMLAEAVHALPRLELRGLMAIPAVNAGQKAFDELCNLGKSVGLDTLSMGMSNDFESAIAAGATHIRLGTALFGPRQDKPNR